MLSRRIFIKAGLSGAVLASAAWIGTRLRFTTDEIRLEEVDVYLKGLPRAYQEYRLGLLSDVHLGPFLPDAWVAEAVQLVKDAGVDLLLLGGDYLNIPDTLLSDCLGVVRNRSLSRSAGPDLAEKIIRRFCEILSVINPPDGIAAVYGNHDRWLAPDVCTRLFQQFGIKLLVNEALIVTREGMHLKILGFDDYWTGIPRIAMLREAQEENEARIVLAHNPDFISEIIKKTDVRFDLGLAGHTHGGQINIPGIGPFLYNIRDRRLSEGLYTGYRSPVYTTRGVGVVEIPYRVNCPAEVSVLTLKRLL
jgi:uncharacterized protein